VRVPFHPEKDLDLRLNHPRRCRWRLFWGRKMKNQIVVAIKNQFAVVLIVGGGIIIAPAVFIVALVRLARINVSRSLTKPVSEKLGAILRAK